MDILREQCLGKMLQAYREESCSAAVTDDLEKRLRVRLRIFSVSHNEEYTITLEAAILSLRGWLLAFSAAAIILLLLGVGLKYQSQSPVGLEEVLTYNTDSAHRDPFLFSDEIDYGR
jgi:hypothetical protein